MVSQEFLDIFRSIDYQQTIGKRLKYARKEFNQRPTCPFKLTQREMAELMHIERQRIMNIENGKTTVNITELIFYSKICGFSINELLFDELDEWKGPYFPEDLNGNAYESDSKDDEIYEDE